MGNEARQPPLWIPFERRGKDGKTRPWPTVRLRALEKKPIEQPAGVAFRSPPTKTLNNDMRRSPLEVLSRLAGGTTFREFSGAHTTRAPGITDGDIAAALGYVKNPLQQRLALALACQTDAEWASVQRLAYPLLMKQLDGIHTTRALVTGKLRYRAKVMLFDAFHDLALLRTPRNDGSAAKGLDMQVRDYRRLYRAVAGFIETNAQEGARTAVDALYRDG